MKKGIVIALLLMWSTLSVNATELKRDGWNLISICQDMNQSEIDMTGIQEIQSQDGESIYTGDWAVYSNLEYLHAGYGYWVKGEEGINFDSRDSSDKLSMPLHRDGWNLMGSCEDIPNFDINMTDWNITEIQNQDGESIYTGDWSEFSNLSGLSKGYGYWVKGDSGTLFTSKRGLSIPKNFDYQTINNLGEIIETTYEDYLIKLFVDHNETADSQANHTGIVVRINGQDAPIMQIQDTYRGQNIVVGVYNIDGKLIGVSNTVVVKTEGSGTFIDVEIEENHPPIYEYPSIDIWGEMVVQEGENSSFWFSTRDIDSIRLAEGTPSFVTLINPNNPASLNGTVGSANIPLSIKKNITINAEDWASYQVEVNASQGASQGYYQIELIGTNNALGMEVREHINLFYGDVAIPSILFSEESMDDPMMPTMIEMNQGDSYNLGFSLENADSVIIKETLQWSNNPEEPENSHEEKIANFAIVDGNNILFNPSVSLETGWYHMVIIVKDSSTGAEIERWIDIQINPAGTNHAPTITLSDNYVTIAEGSTEPVIVTVNITDVDDDNVTFGLDYAPPFVTLVDNNIIIDLNGSNETGMHSVSIYAEDNNSARAYRELKIEILRREHPMVWLMGEALQLDENQSQTWWFSTQDVDSVRLAEGTANFITLAEEDNGEEPLSATQQSNIPREISGNLSTNDEDYRQYRIEINPTEDTPAGYYPIEVIGTNNNLGTEVNGRLNLFYGIGSPNINFEQSETNLNQGENGSINFTTDNADSVEIGQIDYWNNGYVTYVSDFATVNGNSIEINLPLDINIGSYYVEVIAKESTTGGQVSRWLHVEVTPEGSNHRPDINLTIIHEELAINSSDTLIATVMASDQDGDDVTLHLEDNPPFIILNENNITFHSDGTETAGRYYMHIYAEDSKGERSDRGFDFTLIGGSAIPFTEDKVVDRTFYMDRWYDEAYKESHLYSLLLNSDYSSTIHWYNAQLDDTSWEQSGEYFNNWHIDDNGSLITREDENITLHTWSDQDDNGSWYRCDSIEKYDLLNEFTDRYEVNASFMIHNCTEIDEPTQSVAQLTLNLSKNSIERVQSNEVINKRDSNNASLNIVSTSNSDEAFSCVCNWITSMNFNQPQPYSKDELREQGYDDVTVNGSVEFKETNGTTINAPEHATVKITHQNDNWHPALGFNAIINTDAFSQTEFVHTGKYSDGQMMNYQVYIDNNQNALLDENEEVLCSENILFEEISNHFVCQREESHEPIVLNDLVSGVINFVDESTPSDAFVRIIPSVFQNDESGWNGAICKVEDNGSYGQECHIDGNEAGVRDAFNNPDETFQMLVFKNHINPDNYHWNCGEDLYKWVGDSVTSDMFATVDVTSGDYQDRSDEECGENNPTDNDLDGDNIPDSIEAMLGMDNTNPDANDNGILDGLETEGEYGDQFFDKQWHIKSLGTIVNESGVSTIAGNDLDLLGIYQRYMGYNGGNPIIVQIVDDGVDADHEDLIDNMDLSRSYHHSESDNAVVGDPSPTDSHNTHGTMVTGIMAARAFNGIGVRGIIPFAKIAGSNWLEYQSGSGLEKAWLTGDGANEIAVTNNSWGTYFTNDSFYESILAQGTSTLRDGKGRVYVIAAGNDREYYHGNSNLSYISNSRYAVAVGALKNDNTHASYSSPGGNLMISGYSGDYYQNSPTIGTTILEGQSTNSGDINEQTTWSEDEKQNYTFAMNGTSAASPTVSGSIALVLEACPDLTWREIKHLLAKQGKKVDNSNESWVQNSAGLWHSNDYGYGLINPQGMIEACTDSNYTHLGATVTAEISSTVNYDLADGDSVNIGGLNIPQNIAIEWIELTVDSNHSQPSDYSIELISPAGTVNRVVDWTRAGGEWMSGGFKFGVAGFVDENSSGDWAVEISDFNINDENLSGTINSLKIKVYGH